MIERPMLFSAPMVRALLDGSKTQTRRICKPAADLSFVVGIHDPRDFGQSPLHIPTSGWFGDEEGNLQFACPHGKPGDQLWVKETHEFTYTNGRTHCIYKADGVELPVDHPFGEAPQCYKNRPSIFMFRWASRITLEITDVRVERLQDISEADAKAEGCVHYEPANYLSHGGWSHDGRYVHETAVASYQQLWDSINGASSWAVNPWVWVVKFRRVPQ